jgi:hypothetical protein
MKGLLLIILLAILTITTLTQRTQAEVHNCIKKTLAKPNGNCYYLLANCFNNADCSVEFETSGCSIKLNSEPFVACKKWTYKTQQGRDFGACLDENCKIF